MRTRFIAQILCTQLLTSLCASASWAAACIVPPASDEAVRLFKANPVALVEQSADTRTIEATVRDLTATDSSLAAEFVRLAKNTNPRFRTAIAAGLAQAAVACVSIDQQTALLIQQAAASFEDSEFQNVFAAVAGDLSTAATAAAATSADSAVGSVIVTNPTVGSPRNTNFSGGGSPFFFQIVSGGAAINSQASNATNSGTTSAANPVSATH